MPLKIAFTLAAGFVTAALAVSLAAAPAAAGADRRAPVVAHHIHKSFPVRHRYFAGGRYGPGGSVAPVYGPGYVYVPGHGILGAACNLPSSTCSNEYRDIQ